MPKLRERAAPADIESVQIFRRDPEHPLRKRLWQAGLGLALFVSVFVVHEIVARCDGSNRLALGQDFLPVYAAGTLVRQGRAAELYSIAPIAQIERKAVREADLEPLPVYGPYLNPPFFAAMYAPLAALPYREAAALWLTLNLLLLTGSVALLCGMLGARAGWQRWGLVPLLVVLPMPFWQAMCHQQNTFLSLFLLCVTVTLWRKACSSPKHRPGLRFLTWMVMGLMGYKPQLAIVVMLVLVITLGWRALAGMGLTLVALLLLTVWQLPGSLAAYLRQLPPTVQWIQEKLPYNWGRQVTPWSFWRLLLQGHAVGPTHAAARVLAVLTTLAAGGALAVMVLRFVRQRDRVISLELLIATTIVSMPLLVPYYMDYDLLLLVLAAVLLAVDWARSLQLVPSGSGLLLTAWITLFLEAYINPGLAGHTRINLMVPLNAIVFGLSVARCLGRGIVTMPLREYDAGPASLAA